MIVVRVIRISDESGEDQSDGFGDPGGPDEGHQESLKSLFGRGKR